MIELYLVLSIAFAPIIVMMSIVFFGLLLDVAFSSWCVVFAIFGWKAPFNFWKNHSVIFADKRFKA